MKYTLLLQASQIKLITLRLTELLVIVWLIFWTGNYIKHWRDMYRCITMSHFIPRVVLLFCSTLVSLWLTPLWFSLLWSLLMSDVVPYLDEAMQWATDAVIDCHFFSKITLVENVVAMGIPSFYIPFSAKKYPFRVPSFDKWYPFHILCNFASPLTTALNALSFK